MKKYARLKVDQSSPNPYILEVKDYDKGPFSEAISGTVETIKRILTIITMKNGLPESFSAR